MKNLEMHSVDRIAGIFFATFSCDSMLLKDLVWQCWLEMVLDYGLLRKGCYGPSLADFRKAFYLSLELIRYGCCCCYLQTTG
jgi:hypothetical protein